MFSLSLSLSRLGFLAMYDLCLVPTVIPWSTGLIGVSDVMSAARGKRVVAQAAANGANTVALWLLAVLHAIALVKGVRSEMHRAQL